MTESMLVEARELLRQLVRRGRVQTIRDSESSDLIVLAGILKEMIARDLNFNLRSVAEANGPVADETPMKKKILVVGASGKTGSVVAKGLENEHHVFPVEIGDDMVEKVLTIKPDCAVEFTTANSVFVNTVVLLALRVNVIVGATGITPAEKEILKYVARRCGRSCVLCPNFSGGMSSIAKILPIVSSSFESAVIVERHSTTKVDSPSGTALVLQRKCEECGLSTKVHSLRIDGSVSHHEVILGKQGETLTLRHDLTNHFAFVQGVREEIVVAGRIPGLTDRL